MGARDRGSRRNVERGPQIQVVRVTKAFGSDLFDAVATTDNADIWAQPADSILLAARLELDVPFVAAGLTTFAITLGDAGDNDGILVAGAQALRTDAAGTAYKGKGAYFDAVAGTFWNAAGSTIKAYAAAGVANLSTLSAGQVTFVFKYIQL